MIILAQEYAKAFYNSKVWKDCRTSYIDKRIAIDGGMCETCHEELGKIVHHKEWLTAENITNPYITLSHSNLKYDCQTCHNQEKDGEQEAPRYYIEGGQIILIPPAE